MKLILRNAGALAVAGLVTLYGCSVKNNMGKNRYQVEPEVLEVHGDSVAVVITAIVPEKSINSKAALRFEPVLKTGKDGEVTLRSMTVGGSATEEPVDVKVDSKTGGKVTYASKFKYTADMRSARLMSGFSLKKGADYVSMNSVEGVVRELAKGTITTSLLVRNDVAPRTAGDVYKAEINGKSVDIFFAQDKAKFDLAFGIKKLKLSNSGQVNELKKILKKDPTFVPGSIKLTSFASPDGELERNNGLAKSRSDASYTYFKKELKKLGFSQVNDSNFTMSFEVSEDWDGLRKAVEASDRADKNEMLAIITNKSISDDQREEMLRNNHRKSYDWLISDVFPKLRRSSLTVLGSTPLRTEEQIKTLVMAQKYDSLNASELYHLGYVVPGLDNKLMIANYYNKRFPGDWRMHNDKAVVLMMQNKFQEAMASLEEADKLNANNSTVWHNMGVCYLYNNMRSKAADAFAKAGSNYALGIIAIQKGNYSDAISKFSNVNEARANVALAYLLNKQHEEAKKILEKIAPDNQNAYSYYLMAIVGARMNNAELMSSNLTRSIQKAKEEGGDLNTAKKYAAEDLEFRAFFDNPLFQAAVK